MSPGITEEIIARQPPEAQAIIRALLAEIAELKARIEELERQAKGKTPQNSSLPPSTQHPHARPQPPNGSRKRNAAGSPAMRNTNDRLIPTDQCDDVQPLQADRMPALRREALGQRPGAVAASGVGIARDQAARDRIPAASADVSLLRRNDVCGIARRRAARTVGAAVDGLRRPADGLLSPEQAADGRVPRHAVRPAMLPGADGEDPKPSDGGLAAVV